MADLLIATTINSKIYSSEEPALFGKLSSSKLLEFRNDIRNQYDTIIVGANTIKNDNPTLLNINKSNIRVIIDKYCDLDIKSKIFGIYPEKTFLLIGSNNKIYENKLKKLGVNIINIYKKTDEEVIDIINKISNGKILIEGGAKTICMFMNSNFIKNIMLIQFPIILSSDSLSFEQYNNLLIKCKLKDSFVIDNDYIYQFYRVGE